MFDDSDDNCWNSSQGSPQFVLIDFQRPVKVKNVQISFQGGFVGQDGYVSRMGAQLTYFDHTLPRRVAQIYRGRVSVDGDADHQGPTRHTR
jgi:hypothetical protein